MNIPDMLRHAVAAALLLVFGSGEGVARTARPAQQATMFRGDASGTGVYRTRPAYALSGVKFTFPTGGPIRSTAALANGILYFGSDDGFLYAIDALTGAERWRFKTGGLVRSSPAISGGMVYFTSRDGNLYALAAANGRKRWQMALGKDLGNQNYWDYYSSSPILANGSLYVGSGDGHLYAVNPGNGRRLWAYDAGTRIRSTPAATADTIVFGTMGGHLIALDAKDGKERWKYATRGASRTFADKNNDTTSIFASPSIGDGIVTVGGRDGYLYAVDLASGKLRWDATQDGGSWILSTGIQDGIVYVGGGSALRVQANDLKTGADKWQFAIPGAAFASMTIAGDMLYFSDFAGYVHALDKSSGRERWRFPMSGRSLSTPIVNDGIVYASSDAGILYALEGPTEARALADPPKRAVYWQGKKSDEDFSWFANQTDLAILNFFKQAGYEQIDAAQLERMLKEPVAHEGGSVIVLADSKVPQSLAGQDREHSLVRRYLDSGGKIAFLGVNPLALHYDPATGLIDKVDFDQAAAILDVAIPPINIGNGYYGARITDAGRSWGLRSDYVGTGVVSPDQPIIVLARNEFGMASSWAKNYGGPEGTGLLQLNAPRNEPGNLVEYLAAVEHGLR